MLSASTRKQNRSCDQCRKSKRRCLPATESASVQAGAETCRNCKHLQQTCTYNFVNSQSASRRTAKAKRGHSVNGQSNGTHRAPSHETTQERHALHQNAGFNHGNGSQASPLDTVPLGLDDQDAGPVFAPDDIFDLDLFLDGGPDGTFNIPCATGQFPFPGMDFTVASPAMPGCDMATNPSPTAHVNNAMAAMDHQDPASLLTFNLATASEDLELVGVFNSMMGALISRCLHASTNIFATSNHTEYDLSPEGSCAQRGTENGDEHDRDEVTGNETSTEAPVPPEKRPTATMIGLCLFLDHFAPFYGLWSDRDTRQAQLKAFKSVMRAFALHSYPLSAPGSREYRDAWLHARSQLNACDSTPSFVFLYAVFQFTLTTPPEDPQRYKEYEACHRAMLERGLGQFQSLQNLASGHSARLGESSTYRPMLRRALTIFHWYAFIRDTVESLMEDRDPIVRSAVDESNGKPHRNRKSDKGKKG